MNAPLDDVATGISIVCVFNDPAVREECLDQSVRAYRGAVAVDYVAVDNTRHTFASAGAALNHGAQLARHDVVVFVHQDVYLHSIDLLDEAGDLLRAGAWAMLGANGVTNTGENVGRIRDRAQLLGRSAPTPVDVDSLDEVLFMTLRRVVVAEPLTERAELAWHAYAVEYSLRLRAEGRRVGAVDLAVTHNSLTINLAKLDLAQLFTGSMYPDLQPIHTTCGTLGVHDAAWRAHPLIRRYGWRLRWLRHSVMAWRVRKRTNSPVVLSDIRHELDQVPYSYDAPLRVINLDRDSEFGAWANEPLHLTRLGRPITLVCVRSLTALLSALNARAPHSRVLVIGFDEDDLALLAPICDRDGDWLVGIHPDTLWLLGGMPIAELPPDWSRRRAVPLGFRPPAALSTVGGARRAFGSEAAVRSTSADR